MNTKRNVIIIIIIILFYITVGFTVVNLIFKGNNTPKNITKKEVIKSFKKNLDKYDFEYELDIFRFDEESLMKKAFGNVTFNDKLNTTCSISGKLEKKYSGSREKGTKYVIDNTCESSFARNIENYLLEKYDYIDISVGIDYNKAAKKVRNYMKEKQELSEEYGLLKEKELEKDYTYNVVPLVINGNKKNYSIYIDKRNDKVIYDTSSGEYGFIGVSELEEYLELLAKDKIEEKVDELHRKNYGHI